MSLSGFSTTGVSGSIGTNTALDPGTTPANFEHGTMLAWIYVAATVSATIWQRGAVHRFVISGSVISLDLGRANSSLQLDATTANDPILGVNKWRFYAATWEASSSSKMNLWTGDVTSSAAPLVTYQAFTTGSGTFTNTAASPVQIGNNTARLEGIVGQLAYFMFIPRALLQGEIRHWQYCPRNMSGSLGYYAAGFHGTGSIPDLSGNQLPITIGQPPSMSISPHVPIANPFDLND